jgi:glycerol-3-phosphate acyltransferase PlsX
MKIVLDAMGSDQNPAPDVEGAVLAAREYGDTIILVGDQTLIQAELAKYNTTGLLIEIVHAPEKIEMADKPATAGRTKPNSSMHIGMRLVKDGKADAFVTAGNTGVALSIALLQTLRRIPGVHRPALSTILTFKGKSITLLDIGANAECKAEWLAQFAVMGSVYAEKALSCTNPRIALLSNGEEAEKGTPLIHEAAELLRKSGVNFIGNVEPKEITHGAADVVIMDGFSGNILIKSMEAIGSYLLDTIRQELMASWTSKIGGALSKPAFRRVRKQLDPFEIGGAPLLGVNGVVIIGHGRSNGYAIKNAIRQARNAVSGQIVEAIQEGLKGASETVDALPSD